MDDMKRAIYMLALEKISKRKERWVCLALREAFVEITGYNLLGSPESEIIEIFSEFFNLYDARLWYKCGNSILFNSLEDSASCSSWWQYDWKEPRVRILNYILCQH
jgi:hypothetical protein